MRYGKWLCAVWLVGLFLGGCQTIAANDGASVQDGAAQLEAFCRDGVVTIQLRNVGQEPIVVDKELVFFLELDVFDAEGKCLEMTGTGSKPRPTGDVKERFVQLKPGEQVVRMIDLHKGVVGFRYVVGWGMKDGMNYDVYSAYESVMAVPEGASPRSVEVSYRADTRHHFWGAFLNYTGVTPKEVGLYEGPLEVTVSVK